MVGGEGKRLARDDRRESIATQAKPGKTLRKSDLAA
jgi:hypothetical protein